MAKRTSGTGVSRAELSKKGLDWLLESSFLSHLEGPLEDEALGALRWREYGRNEVLIEENQRSRGVDLIVDGQVLVQTRGPEGQLLVVARLGPGHLLGERSLFLDSVTNAQVRATSPVRTLHMTGEDFTRLLTRSEELHGYISDLVSLRQHAGALRDRLLRNTFLRSLGRADFERFVQAGVVERIEPGERLVSVGDRNRDVYVILRGRVAVFAPRRDADGNNESGRELLATKGPGWLFGQAAALLELPRTADIEALETTEVLRVRAQAFIDIIARNPPLQRRLYQQLALLDLHAASNAGRLEQGMIICVYGHRPGLGTSTLAYGIVAALQEEQNPTLIDQSGDKSAARFGLEVEDDQVGEIPVRRMKVPASWGVQVLWPRSPELAMELARTLRDRAETPEPILIAGAGQGQVDIDMMNAADAVVLVRPASESSHDHALRRNQFRVEAVRIEPGADLNLHTAEHIVRVADDEGTVNSFWRRRDLALLVNRNSTLGRAHRRLVRALYGRTVGLALGGGGALGYAHIGLIRTMLAHDMPIDMVAGSSFGALVGGLFAAGGVDALEALVKDRARLLRACGKAVVSTKAFADFVDEITGDRTLETTEIPFYPVSIDVQTGREVVLSTGTVGHGVRSSSGLPGVFPALRHGRTWLVDGGIGNNVPASTVWEASANFIVASNIIPSNPVASGNGIGTKALLRRLQHNTLGRVDHLIRSLYLLMSQTGRDRAAVADVVFDLDLEGYNVYDFLRGPEILESGQRQAEDQIHGILEAYRTDKGRLRFEAPAD